jgi:exonuclease SbcC
LEANAAIVAKARRLESEIADWTLLAMGLRGVIDLVIESSGPGIAALANQLLTDAYGPRFSVRIVTQREQANGRLIECFDISVIDAESGMESSILQKSGGESVWLDKALADAVGLYHQEAAGMNYQVLFADEAEDGLTAERKMQYYSMDRSALALGGYQRKYFISHNPDAWDLADHVIDLAQFLEAA